MQPLPTACAACALCLALIAAPVSAAVVTRLNVLFANGTSRAIGYQLPAADVQRAAAVALGSSNGGGSTAAAACCQPLVGQVARFNTSFALYSGSSCESSTKLCSFPAAARSVWVCGCPGKRCYGKVNVESYSGMVGSANPSTTVSLSSLALYEAFGYPLSITVYSTSSTSSSASSNSSSSNGKAAAPACAVRGIQLEYSSGEAVLGQARSGLQQQQLRNTAADPVMAMAIQAAGGCLAYLELRTKGGRLLRAGAFNHAAPLRRVAGSAARSGLAAMVGFSQQTPPSSNAAQGPLLALKAIWGISHCPIVFGVAGKTPSAARLQAPAPAPAAAAAAASKATAPPPAPAPPEPLPSTGFASCGMSDPDCFSDDECYCRLPNGTYGAVCPMYGSCFGACCATTGVCPNRMGYEDPVTKKQSVLLPKSCGDWGLDRSGAVRRSNGSSSGLRDVLACSLPRNRMCDPAAAGTLCMGYTSCRSAAGCDGQLNGAMCVYRPDGSSDFDVCACLPVYPAAADSTAAKLQA